MLRTIMNNYLNTPEARNQLGRQLYYEDDKGVLKEIREIEE